MSPCVLITGARAPVAQDLARALRAAGAMVRLADSVTPFAARALRPAFPVHRLPGPLHDFAGFSKGLAQLVKRIDPVRIIPTCEEVFWLAEAAARDGYANRLFAPGLAELRRLHSKQDFVALLARLGLRHPQTLVFDQPFTEADLPFALEDAVLKPEFSRFATHTLIAPSRARLRALRPTPQARWVAQRRVLGEELCSWAALSEGRVLAFAAYRPRWRQGRAAAFAMETMNAPQLAEITARIGAATGMSGHLSLDAIRDGLGNVYPIECNPRAVSGLHLFDASPALGRALLYGEPCAPPPAGTLRHLGPAMALLGLPQAMLRGEACAFMRDWRASRDVIDREGRGLVTLGCLADAARFAARGAWAGTSPASATTSDIAWDGAPIA